MLKKGKRAADVRKQKKGGYKEIVKLLMKD